MLGDRCKFGRMQQQMDGIKIHCINVQIFQGIKNVKKNIKLLICQHSNYLPSSCSISTSKLSKDYFRIGFREDANISRFFPYIFFPCACVSLFYYLKNSCMHIMYHDHCPQLAPVNSPICQHTSMQTLCTFQQSVKYPQ